MFEVIVIDKLGYIAKDKAGAEHRFGFFSLCYEKDDLIITTNQPFADWPQIFCGDDRFAGALIIRLTQRVKLLEILRDSYRFNSSLKKKKEDSIKLNEQKSKTKDSQGKKKQLRPTKVYSCIKVVPFSMTKLVPFWMRITIG